jgi:hypothetical protein
MHITVRNGKVYENKSGVKTVGDLFPAKKMLKKQILKLREMPLSRLILNTSDCKL